MVESDLGKLITGMQPELLPGRFVFVELPDELIEGTETLASVREAEGLSAVLRQEDADRLGLDYDFVAGWITLRVESALDAVGLTAAVSACLTDHGVSCNVIAGLRHDHLLVPAEEASRALDALAQLSSGRAEA